MYIHKKHGEDICIEGIHYSPLGLHFLPQAQDDGPHGYIMVHKALLYGPQGLYYKSTRHTMVHANYIVVRRIYTMKHKALHYVPQGL